MVPRGNALHPRAASPMLRPTSLGRRYSSKSPLPGTPGKFPAVHRPFVTSYSTCRYARAATALSQPLPPKGTGSPSSRSGPPAGLDLPTASGACSSRETIETANLAQGSPGESLDRRDLGCAVTRDHRRDGRDRHRAGRLCRHRVAGSRRGLGARRAHAHARWGHRLSLVLPWAAGPAQPVGHLVRAVSA